MSLSISSRHDSLPRQTSVSMCVVFIALIFGLEDQNTAATEALRLYIEKKDFGNVEEAAAPSIRIAIYKETIERLKFMPLLTRRQPPELFLRGSLHKTLKPHKRLKTILAIQKLPLRPSYQLLNLQQTTLVQVCTKTIINLLKHLLQEPIRILLLSRLRSNNLIHKSSRNKLFTGNALAHNERFIRLSDAKTLDEGTTSAAFSNETERGEGSKEEGVRGSVDEVSVGD